MRHTHLAFLQEFQIVVPDPSCLVVGANIRKTEFECLCDDIPRWSCSFGAGAVDGVGPTDVRQVEVPQLDGRRGPETASEDGVDPVVVAV